MLEKYGKRVGYVHLKDVDGEILQRSLEERWSFHNALKPLSSHGLEREWLTSLP